MTETDTVELKHTIAYIPRDNTYVCTHHVTNIYVYTYHVTNAYVHTSKQFERIQNGARAESALANQSEAV